ncbi:MAG TPA: glycosyltransferase, partial [Verrucomicrobiae bacterium]|nr:glycosyltransferase [Verrucomicrobiae bacterium]
MISSYAGIAPRGDLVLLRRLGERLRGRSFLHINSTKSGGGVAEILHRALPLIRSLGLDARWDTIQGDPLFFETTKKIHNALQGSRENITPQMWRHYEEVNDANARRLDLAADAVLVHDPQPAALIAHAPGGTWLWRCHIDVANPQPEVWERLAGYCRRYAGAIFSADSFVRPMDIEEFVVNPSIDPLSEKNRELTAKEISETLERLGVPADRPMVLQVSRFDRFKDPLGVIRAYRIVRKYNDCILVLAGSPADDDPEGAAVLSEVQEFAAGDPDVHVLLLPAGSDLEINALQRQATVVLQKSLKEGFGLTVAEAMWKGKPVVGGATGGIPTQILQGGTGFLVYSEEGAAFRIR